MNKNIKSTLESMIMLTKSTGSYVYRRITDSKARKAYETAIKMCLEHMEHELSFYKDDSDKGDLTLLKFKINDILESVDVRYPTTLFSTSGDLRKYHLIACDQVKEIVTNLEARFITGGSDLKPRELPYKGISLYENKSIF